MTAKQLFRVFFLFPVFLFLRMAAFAQTDAIEQHLWYNEEKTAKIQIAKAADKKFYGKIVWLKTPTANGKPRVDEHNPDSKHQNDPLLGLLILRGFEKDGENSYEGGTVYDPKNGKTYKCIMTAKGDKVDVRGYVGFSLIGRTATWTKAE